MAAEFAPSIRVNYVAPSITDTPLSSFLLNTASKKESRFIKLKTYEKNETAYWEKFKEDLEKQDKSFWLNASFEEEKKGVPVQLGYGVGYKIVEAFYNNAVDKELALNEILNISDASAFFEKSNYSPKHSKK